MAITNVSGTARPTVSAPACGLMFAAIDGAISATEIPMAAQMFSSLPTWRERGPLPVLEWLRPSTPPLSDQEFVRPSMPTSSCSGPQAQ